MFTLSPHLHERCMLLYSMDFGIGHGTCSDQWNMRGETKDQVWTQMLRRRICFCSLLLYFCLSPWEEHAAGPRRMRDTFNRLVSNRRNRTKPCLGQIKPAHSPTEKRNREKLIVLSHWHFVLVCCEAIVKNIFWIRFNCFFSPWMEKMSNWVITEVIFTKISGVLHKVQSINSHKSLIIILSMKAWSPKVGDFTAPMPSLCTMIFIRVETLIPGANLLR